MKTNCNRWMNNKGSILVLVMVVLLAFSLLTVSLLQLGRNSYIQSIQEQRNAQAHWIAEAGLEKAIAMIYASRNYREGLPAGLSLALDEDFDGNSSNGHYTVTVTKSPSTTTAETIFSVESVGVVSNTATLATAAVRTDLTGAPGVHQALLALGGTSYIKQSQSGGIFGDVYIAGSGDVNRLVNGNLEDAEDGNTVSYGGPAVAVDVLDFPHLDPAASPTTPPTYQSLLDYASDTNNADVLAGTYNGPFDLTAASNHIIYVHGDVNIQNDVIGSGTIVAGGAVTFDTNDKTLSSNVRIVTGGDINVSKNNITFGENNELFSMQNILFGGNQNFPNFGVSLVSMEDITILAGVKSFKGIIYAEGRVIVENGIQAIEGTIIAWKGFDVLSNGTITYNPDVFANPNPINFADNFVRTRKLTWQETPYNP